MRYTQNRNGVNEIPLLNAVCGVDMPYWRIDRADSLHSYLSGDVADKLAAYEDAEEQGRLVILPCKVGDTVFYLTGNPTLYSGRHFNRVESTKCRGFYWDEKGLQICLEMPRGNHSTYGHFLDTIFLTREEAEAALKGEANDV